MEPLAFESSQLTQKLQDTSQNLVAAHGSMDLVCRHKEGNQHGDKEPTKPSQALKEKRRGPRSEPAHHSVRQGSWATPNSPCPVPAAVARPSEVPHRPLAPRLNPAWLTGTAHGTRELCLAGSMCYSGGWGALDYLWEERKSHEKNPHNTCPSSSNLTAVPAYHSLEHSALGTRQSVHCSWMAAGGMGGRSQVEGMDADVQ